MVGTVSEAVGWIRGSETRPAACGDNLKEVYDTLVHCIKEKAKTCNGHM